MKNLMKIVPGMSEDGKPTLTHGTRVVLPDGTEVQGVTHIELVAHVNDVWRAKIECIVQPPESIDVLAEVVEVEAGSYSLADVQRAYERDRGQGESFYSWLQRQDRFPKPKEANV